jgi:hypothetical protein
MNPGASDGRSRNREFPRAVPDFEAASSAAGTNKELLLIASLRG